MRKFVTFHRIGTYVCLIPNTQSFIDCTWRKYFAFNNRNSMYSALMSIYDSCAVVSRPNIHLTVGCSWGTSLSIIKECQRNHVFHFLTSKYSLLLLKVISVESEKLKTPLASNSTFIVSFWCIHIHNRLSSSFFLADLRQLQIKDMNVMIVMFVSRKNMFSILTEHHCFDTSCTIALFCLCNNFECINVPNKDEWIFASLTCANELSVWAYSESSYIIVVTSNCSSRSRPKEFLLISCYVQDYSNSSCHINYFVLCWVPIT